MTTFSARNAPTGSNASSAAMTVSGGPSMGRRTLGVGLAATILAAGAYAYTASNTVQLSRAGDGAGVISGYSVTAVQYTLDATDPTLIDKVGFTLDAPATTVRAGIDGAAYAECTHAGANDWQCDFATNPAVEGASSLGVVATS